MSSNVRLVVKYHVVEEVMNMDLLLRMLLNEPAMRGDKTAAESFVRLVTKWLNEGQDIEIIRVYNTTPGENESLRAAYHRHLMGTPEMYVRIQLLKNGKRATYYWMPAYYSPTGGGVSGRWHIS